MTVEMSELIAAVERQQKATANSFPKRFSEREIQRSGGMDNMIRVLAKTVGNVRTFFQDEQLDALLAGHDAAETIEII